MTTTNTERSLFFERYVRALGGHVRDGGRASLGASRVLGLKALALRVRFGELAGVHEVAVAGLLFARGAAKARSEMVRRSADFLAGTLRPMERALRGAPAWGRKLTRTVGMLTRRTDALATANAELRREIARRKTVERSLRTSKRGTAVLLAKSRAMQQELRNLTRRLLLAHEEERRRISRELHDVIAQALTGIDLRLATLKAHSAANVRDLQQRITVTQRMVRKSVETEHAFARHLRPNLLDDLGLIPTMRAHLDEFTALTGVRVRFTAVAAVEELDGEKRTTLYRIAQEALANVAQHAKAGGVTVDLSAADGVAVLKLSDDGVGFAVAEVMSPGPGSHLGLLGMRERAEMVGGAFDVRSAPGRGTTVCVSIPRGTANAPATRSRRLAARTRSAR